MEFLSSLAIKALIGTSVCGTITVGTIYKCDKTLLGFKDNTQTIEGDRNATPDGEKKLTGNGALSAGTDTSTPIILPEVSGNSETKLKDSSLGHINTAGKAVVSKVENALVPTADDATKNKKEVQDQLPALSSTTEVKEKVESEHKVETSTEGDVSTISSTIGQSEKDVVSVINPQVAESEPSTTQENTLDSGSITGQVG